MHLSPRSLIGIAALSLAVASTPAFANTINFDSVVGTSPYVLTTYVDNGFTVTSTGTEFYLNPNQGNPPPGVTAGSFTGSDTSTMTIQETAGGLFTVSSFDIDTTLAPTSGASESTYTVIGYDGATQVFDLGPVKIGTGNTWETVALSSISSDLITSLQLTVNTPSGDSIQLDNIVASPTPEPSSLFLLGTGLISLGAVARRRFSF